MLYILLQADANILNNPITLFAIMLSIMYFFFLRPTANKQKKQDAFIKELEKGKEVVTSSGIIGKVVKLEEKEVTLQVSEKTFVRMTKGSISNELTAAYHKVEEKK